MAADKKNRRRYVQHYQYTYLHDFCVEAALFEPPPQHLPVDVVDGRDAWQHEVEDEEVPLEAVGDVVFATAGVAHGGEVLQVFTNLLGSIWGEREGEKPLSGD